VLHQVIKQVITCDCGVFIPVSIGKNGKNRPRNARVIVESKVAPFFPDTVYMKQSGLQLLEIFYQHVFQILMINR